ncbi:MAG: sulfatase-like hydrolase/transferase, partial [Prolixibacteraceae bacterium]|nr:sulfatase-like hydrolase/transferase [Prolixibacteraceae bacterium]
MKKSYTLIEETGILTQAGLSDMDYFSRNKYFKPIQQKQKKMKQNFSKLNAFALLVFIVMLTYSCKQKPEPEKPNIIVFIADDVSWNDVGCYGNSDVKTPTIDNLASKGIKFNNFYL